MIKENKSASRLFVLDTNILMHDPTALFRFEEHDIFLPMVVLEELDAHKRGLSEVARNVRQTNRILDELLADATHDEIVAGLALLNHGYSKSESARGRIFFQTTELESKLPTTLPGNKADNTILATALSLKAQHPEKTVTVVSKDINLRIKAGVLGIHAEDYYNDRVLDDVSLLHPGFAHLPENFWDEHSKDVESWKEGGHTYYRISGPLVSAWFPNDCIFMDSDEGFEAIVRSKDGDDAIIEVVKDYHNPKNAVWGISARNREQNFAMNVLLDPEIDLVTLQGTAGSGKTLLALAAGLAQVLDHSLYREIIMTRVTVPVGEDIGFLPGSEEEKMTPWMGALLDNLEVLNASEEAGGEWGREVTNDLLQNRIKIRSLNFMRGRTFLNRYIIIDEAQNLTSKQIKTLITRAGPGTKLVCLGDIRQIDTPYLTETTSGLTYAVDRFKHWEHSAHMTLVRGERSRLADFAAETL